MINTLQIASDGYLTQTAYFPMSSALAGYLASAGVAVVVLRPPFTLSVGTGHADLRTGTGHQDISTGSGHQDLG